MILSSRSALLVLALAASTALSACGRKTDLDVPPPPPGVAQKPAAPGEAAPPERRFILDGLIE